MDNNNIFIWIAEVNVLVVTMIYFSWFSEHIIEQWMGKCIMVDMYCMLFDYYLCSLPVCRIVVILSFMMNFPSHFIIMFSQNHEI